MKAWTPEHDALLTALRANDCVPELFRRLSLERLSPSDEDVRRLRGWASSIRSDPGWRAIEPVLRQPTAWPAVWTDALKAGFSPTTHHHHALLFGRFCEAFIQREDYASADWTFARALEAWEFVFASDYPAALFDTLEPSLSDDGPNKADLLRTMLDRLVDDRERDLREAAGVASPGLDGLDRRRLGFAWTALGRFEGRAADGFGTFEHLHQRATHARSVVNAEVLRRFEEAAEDIDLSDAKGDDLLAPYRYVSEYFGIVGIGEQAATDVVTRIVETCWKLRRLGRDETKEFQELVTLGHPFNENLFERLTSFDSAFGHNSRCADFLVFEGELAEGDAKKPIFERGLEVCPGHRNSAMLLSYRYLDDARQLLASAAFALPGLTKSSKEVVRKADAAVRKAEEIYPYNESLPEYRERVDTEAERLGVELPPRDSDDDDAD